MKYTFNFGKHKNLDIDEVYEIDPQYLDWLYKRPSSLSDKNLYDALESKLKDKNTIYLSFGKYKNKSIHWVYENDKKYILWIRGNEYVQTKMKDLYQIANSFDLS
jgi:uncharacterized protein (DUF3820 family)